MRFRQRLWLALYVVLGLVFVGQFWLVSHEGAINAFLPVEDPVIFSTRAKPLSVHTTTMTTKETTTETKPDRIYVSQESLDNAPDWRPDIPVMDPALKADGRITVFLVPHSHTDPGWLQTVQGYFDSRVQRILDLVVTRLTNRTDMTFIWSETIYLHMWWMSKEDNSAMRSQMKKLIKDGRLEIVAGGWVMPDQAVTYYPALVIQLQIAHEWLHREFRVTPMVAWSIDSFGHSPTLAYFWSLSGYKWVVAQRISERYRDILASRRMLEFTWRQLWDRTGHADIFCHIPPYKLYSIPYSCGPDQSVCMSFDFRSMPVNLSQVSKDGEQNLIDRLARPLVKQLHQKASMYNHNAVLLPIGDDFRYETETEWDDLYFTFGQIVRYINNHSEFNTTMMYGTVNDYFMEAETQQDPSMLPLYTGDLLPYADDYTTYWTGFYSSRPEQKRAIRELQEMLHAARIWDSLSPIATSRESKEKLDQAEQTLSLLQHHDAITGTSKSSVVGDYRTKAKNAHNIAVTSLSENVLKIIKSKADKTSDGNEEDFWRFSVFTGFRPQLLSFSNTNKWYILFINSLTHPRHEVLSIVVDFHDVIVTNNYGTRVPVQVCPVHEKERELSTQIYEIQLPVHINAVSVVIYTIKKVTTSKSSQNVTDIGIFNNYLNVMPFHVFSLMKGKTDLRMSNDYVIVVFSPLNGSLLYVYLKESDTKIHVTSEILVYNASGDSGAYVFAPNGEAMPLLSHPPSIFYVSGNLSQKTEVTYPGLTLTYTLYNTDGPNAKVIHVTCRVDSNIVELRNRELILRFRTDIKSRGVLYTDSNGFQFTKRSYHSNRPIAGNFYPITSQAVIRDSRTRFTLHTSHTHGVGSLKNGELEVMLDRLPSSDDGKGLGEGIAYSNAHIDQFALQFEYCVSDIQDHNETFLPSLESTVSNDYLQNPIYTIVTNTLFEQNTFSVMSEKIPNDTVIVTMKHTLKEDSQQTLRLVLHRRATVPRCGSRGPPPPGPPINLWSLVGEIYVTYVKEMSLTFLERKRSLKMGELVYLEPMELAAFEIGLVSV